MNLLDKQVTHEKFGKGTVVKHHNSLVQIHFASGNKKFVFPDAFGTFLTLIDQKAAGIVDKIKQEKEAAYKQEKLKQLRVLESEISLKNQKINPNAQVAFWCKEEEQEKVLTEWRVFFGRIKSGVNKGKIKKPTKLQPSSVCAFTVRDPNMEEKDRYIQAVYLVDEGFLGKSCEDGYIPSHPKYRLRLTEAESRKILFWNYYANKKYPQRMTWNAGRCRYFDNTCMAQILRDIVSLKHKKSERQFAQDFFEHFCRINLINRDELPKPNGVLKNI